MEIERKTDGEVKNNKTVKNWRKDKDDDQIIEAKIRLSVLEALKSEDSPQWLEALNREKTKFEAANTWREPTDEEIKQNKKVIPIAILLTKKRDGTFKARACVLGNLVNTDGINVYAPPTY